LLIATGGGFVAGVVAPYVPGGIFGASLLGGTANLGQYGANLLIKGEKFSANAAAVNFGIGAISGAIGGAVNRITPYPYGRTAASREMVDESTNAANVRLNTGYISFLRSLSGGLFGGIPITDTCGCVK
jgi:hypothetical protein